MCDILWREVEFCDRLNGRKARAYQIRPGLQCRGVELHSPKIVQTENGDELKRQMREKVYLFPKLSIFFMT